MSASRVTTHGKSGTKAYQAWSAMIRRTDPLRCTEKDRRLYVDRQITVCDRWKKFENFYADMGDPPKGRSLDRYPDNDGNYELTNCRWATISEQNRNRRRWKVGNPK